MKVRYTLTVVCEKEVDLALYELPADATVEQVQAMERESYESDPFAFFDAMVNAPGMKDEVRVESIE